MKQDFIEAVNDKHIEKIQSYLISEMIEDPTFSTDHLPECLDYVKSNGVDIFVKYEPTPCETAIPEAPEQWDKKLFFDKLEDLRLNFAYEERIDAIKKIGKKAFEDSKNFEEAPEIHRSREKTKWFPILIGAVVTVIMVAMVITVVVRQVLLK